MKILVVEDNLPMRQALEFFLRDWGHEVTLAESVEEGWSLFLQNHFQIVISDWMMPALDGLELVHRIRSHPRQEYVFIILLTAKRDIEDLIEGMEAGADDFISKPFERDVLRARLRAGERLIQLEQNLLQRNRQLEETNRKMKEGIAAAAEIQKAFLPQGVPQVPGFHFEWAFKPCDQLAGDMLNVFQLDEHHVGLYLLDVSGHGMASALLAVTLSRLLSPQPVQPSLLKERDDSAQGYRIVPPLDVVTQLNHRFTTGPATNQFFTLVYGILDLRTGDFRYVSAGHPGPIYLTRGVSPQKLAGGPPAVGILETAEYKEHAIKLRPGDRLILYSDGLLEAANAKGEIFDEPLFLRSLDQGRSQPLGKYLTSLLNTIDIWRGKTDRTDDVSMLAVESV